jgi:hypothetical protein
MGAKISIIIGKVSSLLYSFKSLQEEYAEKEAAWARGGSGGISDEQYRQL